MPDASVLTLFLVGLLGGTHCIGMCGGIVGALATGAPPGQPLFPLHLAYNLGRIASYVAAGAVAGAIGQAFGALLPVQRVLYFFANLLLVGMGAYLLGFTKLIAPIERCGSLLWARLQPLTGGLLPVRGVRQALSLGLLWGWLPCGLVYSALATALAAGSALGGATAMLAFGLGTLPNLLLAGLLLTRFRRWVQARWLRWASGCLVLGFGLVGLMHGLA